MKLSTLMVMLFLVLIAPPVFPQQAQGPLGKDQVMDLVKYGMSSAELVKKIKDLGIDFEVSDDYLQALRKAGAAEAVIQALRAVLKPSPLTREQVGKLVAGGVPSERAIALVKQRGIDFQADEPYLETLRLAGASDALLAALRETRKAAAPGVGRVRENPKDGLKYVWIPPGTFMMGCSPRDSECGAEEKPVHQVTIAKGFWMGQTEVTVAAYRRFAGSTGAQMAPAPDFNARWNNQDMPIVNVSWDDATAFCGWAGGRLPTEAEWEYAARAGSTEALYGPIDEVAWYSNNSGGKTHEVAQKRANAWNLYDTLGNVWEWVNDWYGGNYYPASPERDPRGPDSGKFRGLRGGSWNTLPRGVRVADRYGSDPASRYGSNGFRCGGEVFAP